MTKKVLMSYIPALFLAFALVGISFASASEITGSLSSDTAVTTGDKSGTASKCSCKPPAGDTGGTVATSSPATGDISGTVSSGSLSNGDISGTVSSGSLSNGDISGTVSSDSPSNGDISGTVSGESSGSAGGSSSGGTRNNGGGGGSTDSSPEGAVLGASTDSVSAPSFPNAGYAADEKSSFSLVQNVSMVFTAIISFIANF